MTRYLDHEGLLSTTLRTSIEHDGCAVIPSVLRTSELNAIVRALVQLGDTRHSTARGGVRDVFRLLPSVQRIAVTGSMWTLASSVLGAGCAAVRAIIFDKTPGANWKVSWHQDLTIAVRERREAPGFGPWSTKAGIQHVQAPVAILESMLTLRLHLDPCGPDNGPVRVLTGSHRAGRLTGAEIDEWRARVQAHSCVADRGDILAMRPLLLHASSPSASPQHRRVIHIEYAGVELPHGLEWFEAWRPGQVATES